MSIKKSKIKLLKKLYEYSKKLLNICNRIEYLFNRFNIDMYNYNLNNIHSEIENTFNYKLFDNLYYIFDNNSLKNYSYVYKTLNNYIEQLENIIKIYKPYLKNIDILTNILINDLKLNTHVDKSNFLLSYSTYKAYNFFK